MISAFLKTVVIGEMEKIIPGKNLNNGLKNMGQFIVPGSPVGKKESITTSHTLRAKCKSIQGENEKG